MKKVDFLKFIDSKQACPESKDWIKSLPVEDIDAPIWAKYLAEAQHGWVEWLAENIRGDITAKYLRVKDTALAEYERVWSTALAEYERVWSTALAEYERVRDAARAEYERIVADAARKLLTFEAVSQVVDNFLKTC